MLAICIDYENENDFSFEVEPSTPLRDIVYEAGVFLTKTDRIFIIDGSKIVKALTKKEIVNAEGE